MPTVDYGPKVEDEVRRIASSGRLTERDRKTILEYKRDLEVRGLSKGRIFKILIHTRKFAEELHGTSLVSASGDGIKDLVAWVQNRDLAESTKADYKQVLKQFFKWLNDGEYPKKVSWIRATIKKNEGKLPEKLLTEEDVQKLVDAARNPRDRALISLIWETGARPGEYLDLKVGDIEDRENGKKVLVSGKTGPRRLPLVSSVPHLNRWIAFHPANGDPEAPLWCRLDGNRHERIDYDYFRNLLREIAERAGVDKPMYPYAFRHARATYLANRLMEAQLCQYFGWVQGSKLPSTYVHLSGRDIDITYDRIHGLAGKDEETPKLSPGRCPRCGEIVEARGKFCPRCGLPMTQEVAQRLQENEEIAKALYDEGVEAAGNIKKLVEKMVSEKLKEILGKDYGRK